jgi:hypothetical protein
MIDNIDDENISFCIDDTPAINVELDVSQFLGDTDDHKTSIILNYQLNMNVRQLLQICDYYGISKGLGRRGVAKIYIICLLVDFEENVENYSIVSQRRLMWFYIAELKNDKFMKKFLFW